MGWTFREYGVVDIPSTIANLSMSPSERKAALKATGKTGAALAKRLGVTQSVVSETLNETRAPRNPRSVARRRVKVAIARAIGRPIDEVFPASHRRATDAPAAL